jgi:hypothetical protein
MLENDDLSDVTMSRTMSRQWTVQLFLTLHIAAPEVEAKHSGGEKEKPGHDVSGRKKVEPGPANELRKRTRAATAYPGLPAGNDEGIHSLRRHPHPKLTNRANRLQCDKFQGVTSIAMHAPTPSGTRRFTAIDQGWGDYACTARQPNP